MKLHVPRRWMAILGVSTGIYAFGNLFQPTVVVGESMTPTLPSGRLIWVDRTYYRTHRPSRGEVVVFRLDGDTYVKRIYRGPGETFDYTAAGSAWVAPVRTGWTSQVAYTLQRGRAIIQVRRYHVPDDSVFVLGDNYPDSQDSRQLGPIPISAIIGRADVEVDGTIAATYEVGPRPHRVGSSSVSQPTSAQPANLAPKPDRSAMAGGWGQRHSRAWWIRVKSRPE